MANGSIQEVHGGKFKMLRTYSEEGRGARGERSIRGGDTREEERQTEHKMERCVRERRVN